MEVNKSMVDCKYDVAFLISSVFTCSSSIHGLFLSDPR